MSLLTNIKDNVLPIALFAALFAPSFIVYKNTIARDFQKDRKNAKQILARWKNHEAIFAVRQVNQAMKINPSNNDELRQYIHDEDLINVTLVLLAACNIGTILINGKLGLGDQLWWYTYSHR